MVLPNIGGTFQYKATTGRGRFIISYCLYSWLTVVHSSVYAVPLCQQTGSGCKITCTDIPGYGDVTVDLSSIDGSPDDPSFKNIEDSDGRQYSYDWSPCTKFSIPGSSSCIHGVNVCQHSKGDGSYDAGSSLSVIYSPHAGVVLKYNGDHRVTKVAVRYEDGEKGRVSKVTEYPPRSGQYSMTLYTKFAMHKGGNSSGGGISTGTVLVIVFFVLVFAYFAIGITFLKYRRGAQGKDMIPNYTFWSALPGLIKDGCIFFYGKVKGYASSVKETTEQATQGDKNQYEKI